MSQKPNGGLLDKKGRMESNASDAVARWNTMSLSIGHWVWQAGAHWSPCHGGSGE